MKLFEMMDKLKNSKVNIYSQNGMFDLSHNEAKQLTQGVLFPKKGIDQMTYDDIKDEEIIAFNYKNNKVFVMTGENSSQVDTSDLIKKLEDLKTENHIRFLVDNFEKSLRENPELLEQDESVGDLLDDIDMLKEELENEIEYDSPSMEMRGM